MPPKASTSSSSDINPVTVDLSVSPFKPARPAAKAASKKGFRNPVSKFTPAAKAAAAKTTAGIAKKVISFAKFSGTQLVNQLKSASEKTIAVVMSELKMGEEQTRNETRTNLALKKAELKVVDINLTTPGGEIYGTIYRTITEEGIEEKTSQISKDLQKLRDSHTEACLKPLLLVRCGGVIARSFLKMQAENISDYGYESYDWNLIV